MSIKMRTLLPTLALTLAAALSACSSMDKVMSPSLKLTGDQEVPPVSTAAVGTGTITVASDGSVSGSVKTQGIAGSMAHIHLGAAGKNGPVIVPLAKTADGVWSVPVGAKLKDDQLAAYKMGDLYVNVHSAEHKGGEIRAQLKP
ncbi:MAG: CHRD domain-containing protein [Ideonella sp.]